MCPAVKKTKEKESYKEAKYNTSNNHSWRKNCSTGGADFIRRSRLVKEMIHKTTENDNKYKKIHGTILNINFRLNN